MNADFAQRIALVAHGNAFLSGLIDRPPDLLAENSAFQHTRSVEFRMAGRSTHRIDLWLSALGRRGTSRLRLRSDDLAAEGDGVREVWIPSSVLLNRRFELSRKRALERLVEAGDQRLLDLTSSRLAEAERPWRLYYDQEPQGWQPRRGPMLEESRAELVEAVKGAQEFSRRHKMGFVAVFGKSLALLRPRKPTALPRSDLLPAVGYSVDARRVAAAAEQAWVFGPWGWSDSVVGTDSVMKAFWRHDAKLRTSVIGALIAAANSFDGSQNGSKAV